MADYAISGVWKDEDGVITHYALHQIQKTNVYPAKKVDKSDVLELLDAVGKTAIAIIWNYNEERWKWGQEIHAVHGRYLRTNHDNTVKDNLSHLINYGLVANNF